MKKMDLPATGSDAFWQTPCVVLEGDFRAVTGVRLCRLNAIPGKAYRVYTFSLFFRLLRRGFERFCLQVDGKIAASRQSRGPVYDTPENRAMKLQLQLVVRQLLDFQKQYARSAYQPSKTVSGSVDSMVRALQDRIQGPILGRVLPRPGALDREVQGYLRLLEWGLDLCRALVTVPAEIPQQEISVIGLPLGLLTAWVAVSPGLVLGELTLPHALAKDLAKTHWDKRDVLVGSLGSMAQLRDNLNRNYYYVPARHFQDGDLNVQYIALYQSRNLFGEDAGIRYYGEVTYTRRLRRRSIDHPLTRDNGQELYYAFRVRQWKILPTPIAIREEWVNEPRFTNLFLLEHGRETFELFNLYSAEQYRLLTGIRQALEKLRVNGGGIVIWRIRQDRLVVVTGHWITVTNGKGETLYRIEAGNFSQNLRREFRELRKYV